MSEETVSVLSVIVDGLVGALVLCGVTAGLSVGLTYLILHLQG